MLSFAKFAPHLRARTSWKSKSLKRQVLGFFWRFKVRSARQAQGVRRVAKYVAGAGICEGCKNVVDLKRVRNDAFRVAGAGFVMSLFEVSDAESGERLQLSC